MREKEIDKGSGNEVYVTVEEERRRRGQGQAGEEMRGEIAQVAAEGLATQALEPEFRFPTPTYNSRHGGTHHTSAEEEATGGS